MNPLLDNAAWCLSPMVAAGFGVTLWRLRRLMRRRRRNSAVLISRLPPGFVVSIQENLDRYQAIRQTDLIPLDKLKTIYAGRTELAQEAERACRQQTATLRAQEERDLAKARSDLLSSMTPQERGLLASTQAARAEAELRMAPKFRDLEKELGTVEQEVSRLRAEKKVLQKERSALSAEVEKNRSAWVQHNPALW